jgi:Cu-processing system permease protein
MITIRHLSKRYGRRKALDDVSLTVRPGEVTLLLGANGAGKSTLLRCLLGITGYEGEIDVAGHDPLCHGPAVRAMIGYMPQSGGLHLDLTVAETTRLYAGIRRAPIERADALLVEAGLGDHRDTPVGELSGGMRQRLGFALALLPDPSILVLDEPSSSLDVASRQWLARRLREVAAEGRTVILSTHAGQELLDAGDQHIVLEEGRILSATRTRPAPTEQASGGRSSRAPARGTVRPLVVKELRDAVTNRWLLGYALLLGALGLAATATGLDSTSGLAMQAFGRTTATLMNLCLLLAPLVAVLMGAGAIAAEQERGTLDHLLAQPLTRRRLLLAKHVALLTALTGATLAGFTPAGVVVLAAGPEMFGHYLLFPAIAALAGAAMVSVGLLISVTSRSAVQAQGTAVFTWFAFVLLYDLVLMGSLAVSGMPAEWLAAALVANPVDAARVLGVLALEPDLYLLGPAGAYIATTLGGGGAAAVLLGSLLCWATLPTVGAMVTFMKPLRRMRSHGHERHGAAAGERRAGRDDCVRVGERVAGIQG